MRVLVVGQGGREHALAWKLRQSPQVTRVYCAPGNAGTEADAVNVDLPATDIERLVKFAREEQVALAVIGPEAPLALGMADAMSAAGIRVFGPSKAAARLEGSKAFAKEVMKQGNIPTGDFRVFTDPEDAIASLKEREEVPIVIKADGICAGKGVTVCGTREEAITAIQHTMVDRAFGEAGGKIVVEERLFGEELSILAVVDGKTIILLDAAQDHKAAYDDDQGPNTGGMGAYSPAPLATPELLDTVLDKVFLPTVHQMRKMGCEFRGILYAGIMVTIQGPKVLEFNVRFGDPEAQPILMRLQSDLFELLSAAADGRLKDLPTLQWDPRPAVCVVMASDGYPGDYKTGLPIRGLEQAATLPDTKVFHAGTARQGGAIVNNGGRVLGVTALGDDLAAAKRRAYEAVKVIRWDGAWCRKDISDKARR